MKSIAAFVCLSLFFTSLRAQCTDVDLATFQALQRADSGVKEARIMDLGFDLHSTYTLKGGVTMRRYNKCWTGEATLYKQIILWNTSDNTLMLLLKDEADFKRIKSAIEDRASSGYAQKGPDFYIGQIFVYRYSLQQMDQVPYYSLSISFKS